MELVLKRLGLGDLLASEMKNLDDIAALPIKNLSDPFAFCKDSDNRDVIAQTQRILANIQRQNQEKSRLLDEEEVEIGVKRKQANAGRTRATKKVKLCTEKIESSSSSEEECDKTGVDRVSSFLVSKPDIETKRTASQEAWNHKKRNESISEELPSVLGSPITSSTQV